MTGRTAGMLARVSGIALVIAGVTPATAQTTPATDQSSGTVPADPAQGDEPGADIVVTGFRQSLERAITLKRNADVVSDVISAEDIGKFPDQNVADSLQRITGVQITRSRGEGSQVSVRGLSPDFTQTRYNGRVITSPSGGRSFEFSTLSSDFVSAVSVNKTPTADMIDGGIAATVDIRTARPIDAGRNRVALTAEGVYEQKSENFAPHISGFVNHVFKNGEFGINFGVNWQKRSIRVDSLRSFGLENGQESARTPRLDYNRDGDFNDSFRFNHEAGIQAVIGETERLTGVVGVQAKPAPNVDLHADMLWSRFSTQANTIVNTLRFTNIVCPAAQQGAAPGGCIRDSVVENGIVTFLDADGVDYRNTARGIDQRDRTFSAAGGATIDFGKLKIAAEATHSASRRVSTGLGLGVIGRASASEDLRVDGSNLPQINFTRGYNPLNPANFVVNGFNGDYERPTDDYNTDGRIDLSYATDGFLKKLQVGGYAGERKQVFATNSVSISARTLATALGLPFDAAIEGGTFNAAPFMTSYTFDKLLSAYTGPVTFPATFLDSDVEKLYARIPLATLLAATPPTRNLASEYSVTEVVKAAYARADFTGFDGRLGGNIGVRYVHTDQTSAGYAPDLSLITFTQAGAVTRIPGVTPSLIHRSYSNWLPSFNARFDLTSAVTARIAAARVMSRPTLGTLSPSTTVNANTRFITINNPLVDPYLADQYDVSLEYYFGRGGLISIAGFYKDVKNFVVSTTRTESLNVVDTDTGQRITLPFTISQPDNGAGAKLKGVEVAAQVPFFFLPAPFDGFGIYANYTRLDATDVVVTAGQPAIPLSGVSKHSYNLVGYYEKGPFSVRGAYNFRSGFVSSSTSTFGDGAYVRSYGQLDASASFDVTRNVTITAEAQNLSNASVRTYQINNVGRGYEDVGRRFTAGVRAKF